MYEFLNYQVQDVMSEPVTLRPDAGLAEMEELLDKNGFNGIPVVDDDRRLLGWVTSLDLLRAFAATGDSTLPPYERIMQRRVGEIMTLQPLTVTPRAPLTRVLEKMVDSRNKSFPVVEGDQLVGVVAREDVMEALRRAEAGEKPGRTSD